MVKKSALLGKVWGRLIGLIALIIGLNFLSSHLYKRLDLTKEKRYTLSEASKRLLSDLDDVIYINIYLEGDMPSEYRLLKNEVQDMLEEFRYESDGLIDFEFEDRLSDEDVKNKESFLKEVASKGLIITRPDVKVDEAPSEKFIIPGGVAYFEGKEYTINFLKREFGKPLEEEINGSIELLEYEIGNLVRKCIAGNSKKVGFLRGHGELTDIELADIAKELGEFYRVEPINININDTNCVKPFIRALRRDPEHADEVLVTELIKEMGTFDGIVVAKPTYPFQEIEKFILDQYVMNGGKVIWLVENLIAEMDSVAKYGSIFTADYQNNIDDILFKFGVRVNPTLIQDIQSHGIPVLQRGGSNKPGFLPWVYYPLLTPNSQHPISRNLESVWGRFVGTIDTTNNKDIKKTVLLQSSENSRVAHNPVNISMNMLEVAPDPNQFNKPFQTAAVLLEGTFKSSFAYREGYKQVVKIPFSSAVEKNKMIVIADGDFIRNQVTSRGEVYPLGYDRYATKYFGEPVTFANKKFFLNCVDYLCDNSNIIEVRSKEIVLRLLDKQKVRNEKTKWQLINMILPLVCILIFGLINGFIRKKAWA